MSRLAQLTKLFAADPADADVAYMIAQEHAKASDTRTAVEWYDRCLALNPHYHYAYFHKAKSLETAGDIAAAVGALTEGLARARAKADTLATNEIAGYLEMLGGT